jgi:hypothetical protein
MNKEQENNIVDYYKMHTIHNAGLWVKDVIPQRRTVVVSGSHAEVSRHAEPVTKPSIATDPKYYPLFYS